MRLRLSLHEPAFRRQIKRPQTALLNLMEESVIKCWVRQIRLVFAVSLFPVAARAPRQVQFALQFYL